MKFAVLLFLVLSVVTSALYNSNSDVVQVTDKTFKDEVLKHPGIAIVEFFAPWCGHCKSLAPEYEKAATALKGVVKIVAVDATTSESLAQKYQIQGFPTLKVFGADKKAPVDYQGQRTADGIISEAMKAANQLVKDRKKGKSSSSSSSSGSKSSGSKGGSKSSGSAVVTLTEDNFKELVLDSGDHWLVEFYAPWCGHCKNLAPEWEAAASELKGSVKLGAVDATVASSLAQQYGVKGYPTIKLFPAGPKSGKAQDYNGPREANGIVQYALKSLEEAGVPPTISQITGPESFTELCGQTGRICAVLFVPHIYDSSAAERNRYIDNIVEIAKNFRGKPLSFAWSEGTAQQDLEKALDINFAYPTLALLSTERKVFAVQKLSWSVKNAKTFINGVLSGSDRKSKLAEVPTVVSVQAWDGKDATLAQDEIPLDQLLGDE